MPITDPFKDIDIKDLIGKPLPVSGETMSLVIPLDSTGNVEAVFGEGSPRIRIKTAEKTYKEDGGENIEEAYINVPTIALTPIPALALEVINMPLSMEVKESSQNEQNS
jgi:hypothetical protein